MAGEGVGKVGHLIPVDGGGEGLGIAGAPSEDHDHLIIIPEPLIGGDGLGDPVAVVVLKEFNLLPVDASGVVHIGNCFPDPKGHVFTDIGGGSGHIVQGPQLHHLHLRCPSRCTE